MPRLAESHGEDLSEGTAENRGDRRADRPEPVPHVADDDDAIPLRNLGGPGGTGPAAAVPSGFRHGMRALRYRDFRLFIAGQQEPSGEYDHKQMNDQRERDGGQ